MDDHYEKNHLSRSIFNNKKNREKNKRKRNLITNHIYKHYKFFLTYQISFEHLKTFELLFELKSLLLLLFRNLLMKMTIID